MKKIILILLTMSFLIPISAQNSEPVTSELVLLNVQNGKEKVILREERHFEAPNWSRDGHYLIINAGGLLEKVSVNGDKKGVINTGFADNCNNDHGLSFDGRWLVVSHNDPRVSSSGGNSRIFILPAVGGVPRLVTSNCPSYWHGISPDNEWVVYCAMRNGEWDVWKAHTIRDEEVRLTDAAGLDDGPEYSYDGRWIYFNSHRTGRMHIYRMRPDGSGQEQLTSDGYDNWFPHPGPDNRSIVYISYLEDQQGGHPFGKDVKIRLLDVESGESRDLTPVFYGGQGSLNVHSWSPDGRQIAYVRYIRP
ncbi:MAG: transporter [Proteiniphilum sp.]|jgi:Tol biopolymer transport system component|nr:transporter [Proteiniphilum sp.]HHT34180.1 TolB family protein [Bacteroidales bacterium]MDD2726943.1 transporter [Proteiniphilum sp.]MDD3333117.1 transporter [Proteiniphilum sp.]MDD3556284.1 transporter [Proteiniphilum sp.]